MRRARQLDRLRAILRERQASLADDFEYRIFFAVYVKDKADSPQVFEAEKVGLSMTNNQEKAIMDGVRAHAYSEEEAHNLISRDTVQLHVARWFSLDSASLGAVEGVNLLVWPRPDLQRLEMLCFSRWKATKTPFKLIALRFCIYQDEELSRNVIPYLVKCIKGHGKRGGILFNNPQSFGLWVTPTHAESGEKETLNMYMTSCMLCFSQEELTRWDGTVSIDGDVCASDVLDIIKQTSRHVRPPFSMPAHDTTEVALRESVETKEAPKEPVLELSATMLTRPADTKDPPNFGPACLFVRTDPKMAQVMRPGKRRLRQKKPVHDVLGSNMWNLSVLERPPWELYGKATKQAAFESGLSALSAPARGRKVAGGEKQETALCVDMLADVSSRLAKKKGSKKKKKKRKKKKKKKKRGENSQDVNPSVSTVEPPKVDPAPPVQAAPEASVVVALEAQEEVGTVPMTGSSAAEEVAEEVADTQGTTEEKRRTAEEERKGEENTPLEEPAKGTSEENGPSKTEETPPEEHGTTEAEETLEGTSEETRPLEEEAGSVEASAVAEVATVPRESAAPEQADTAPPAVDHEEEPVVQAEAVAEPPTARQEQEEATGRQEKAVVRPVCRFLTFGSQRKVHARRKPVAVAPKKAVVKETVVKRKPKAGPVCFKCGASGHLMRDCPEKNAKSGAEAVKPPKRVAKGGPPKPSSKLQSVKCYKCGQLGHLKRDCPHLRSMVKANPPRSNSPVPSVGSRGLSPATSSGTSEAERGWEVVRRRKKSNATGSPYGSPALKAKTAPSPRQMAVDKRGASAVPTARTGAWGHPDVPPQRTVSSRQPGWVQEVAAKPTTRPARKEWPRAEARPTAAAKGGWGQPEPALKQQRTAPAPAKPAAAAATTGWGQQAKPSTRPSAGWRQPEAARAQAKDSWEEPPQQRGPSPPARRWERPPAAAANGWSSQPPQAEAPVERNARWNEQQQQEHASTQNWGQRTDAWQPRGSDKEGRTGGWTPADTDARPPAGWGRAEAATRRPQAKDSWEEPPQQRDPSPVRRWERAPAAAAASGGWGHPEPALRRPVATREASAPVQQQRWSSHQPPPRQPEAPRRPAASNDGWGHPNDAGPSTQYFNTWDEPQRRGPSPVEQVRPWERAAAAPSALRRREASAPQQRWGQPALPEAPMERHDGWNEQPQRAAPPENNWSHRSDGWGDGPKSRGSADGWKEGRRPPAANGGWTQRDTVEARPPAGWRQPEPARPQTKDSWEDPPQQRDPSPARRWERAPAAAAASGGWGQPEHALRRPVATREASAPVQQQRWGSRQPPPRQPEAPRRPAASNDGWGHPEPALKREKRGLGGKAHGYAKWHWTGRKEEPVVGQLPTDPHEDTASAAPSKYRLEREKKAVLENPMDVVDPFDQSRGGGGEAVGGPFRPLPAQPVEASASLGW